MVPFFLLPIAAIDVMIQREAGSANFTVLTIRVRLVTDIFLCKVYFFQKTSQASDAQKNTPIL